MKSKTINYWEQIEKHPTESYKEFFVEEKKFLQENVPKESIVLDLGFGTGKAIKILSPIAKKIIGIDNDKKAIEKCKNNVKSLKNVKVSLQDAEKTHFKDNSFDVVVCMGSTFDNFGETKTKILLEIKRVLKNKGLFILGVYNENALKARLKFYKMLSKEFILKGKGKVIFNKSIISEQFSEDEIRTILKKNKFKILNITKGKIFYLIKTQIKK